MMRMMMQTKQNIQRRAENSLAAIMSYICTLITNIICHHGRIVAAQSSLDERHCVQSYGLIAQAYLDS
jgi:hypothetical protein